MKKQECYDDREDEKEIEKEQTLLSQPPSPSYYRKRHNYRRVKKKNNHQHHHHQQQQRQEEQEEQIMTMTVDKSNDKNIIESLNPSTAVNINTFSNEKDTDDNNNRKLVCDITTNIKIMNEKEECMHKHAQMNNDKDLLHPIINNFYTINKSKSALTPFENNTTTIKGPDIINLFEYFQIPKEMLLESYKNIND